MARIREAVGVLNGLGRVAVAYSAEVSRELGEIVNRVPNFPISGFSHEERGGTGGQGLPDDFLGWENFTTGEFGFGAEYNSPMPTPPNAYHPKSRSIHDITCTDSQTHEDVHQQHTPPLAPTSDVLNGHGGQSSRSFHTVAGQGLFINEMKAFHKLKKRTTGVQRYMTSGDTVVGPTAANDDKTQGSHVEQQQKVTNATDAMC